MPIPYRSLTQHSQGMNMTSGSSHMLNNSFNEQREIQMVQKAENKDLLALLTKNKDIYENEDERIVINRVLKRMGIKVDDEGQTDQNESGFKPILKTGQDSNNNQGNIKSQISA